MSFNLIVPVAADKPEYEHIMPHVFSLGMNGFPLCVKSIQGIDLSLFDTIFFAILQKHDKKYRISDLLQIHLERMGIISKSKIVLLPTSTQSQPETIMKVIESQNISGAIMVKDADSYFEGEIIPFNSVCTFPLDKLGWVNPQNKSYLSIDDGFFITNIIEKRIIGRDFCSGGYIFENVDDFIAEYEELKSHHPLYMSHIVFDMILKNKRFRPIACHNYQDWGTQKDWMNNNF